MADSWTVHVETIRHPDQVSRTRIEAALKALLDISKNDESARLRLANGGALAPLIAVAARVGEYWDGIRQVCLQVLATISWHPDTGLPLVEAGMLSIAINALEDADEVNVGRAMGILNNIAMYEKARKQMLGSGVLSAVRRFLGKDALVGLDAEKTVAYLVGREDAKEHEMMVAGDGSIARLLQAAQLSLQGHKVCGLKLSMMGLLKAVRLIAINDNNKTRLVQAGAVGVLVDAAEKRREHAGLALGALLELSFDPAGMAELRALNSTNSLRILHSLLSPGEEGATDEVRRDCRDILFMLKQSQAPLASPVVKRKHMMVSYAWAQKRIVQRMCKELRRAGQEVWRDEEGSSVVPPIGESTADSMAQAIEAASVVLVCVSREYKDSGNCRMECKYAKALEAAGRLKIVYLMMEEDFTTRSTPPIGGWLRLYMEDALWYACWDDELAEAAAGKVAKLVREREGEKEGAGGDGRAAESKSETPSRVSPQLAAWLAENQLSMLLAAFEEHEVFDLRTALKMQPQDVDLLSSVVGRRVRLRDALAALRGRTQAGGRAPSARSLLPSSPRPAAPARPGLNLGALLNGNLLDATV